jgi:hypothetical protein
MRRALLGILIFLSLPALARASDAQLLSSLDEGTQFSAAAPWVLWSDQGVPRLWKGVGLPSSSSPGVYRVADPAWQTTSVSIPVK